MAKAKVKKSGMSPQTKRTLLNVGKSIISNQSCIDGAKESPWWIALIFLVVATILPALPIFVNNNKTYGASFVEGANYGSDRGLANTTETLHAEGYEFIVTGGHMKFYKDGSEMVAMPEGFVASDTINGTYNFLFYITDLTGSELSKYVDGIRNTKYIAGTVAKYDDSIAYPDDTKFYSPSFIILTPNTMAVALYKSGTTDLAANTYGGLNWNTTKEGDVLTRMLDVNAELTNYKRTEAIFNNWKIVFNSTYMEAKVKSVWTITGIYLGVYAGLILFLGLMIFLLTRGKNNIFRSLSFFTCQKISWWASFTPAVLGMIIGWVLPGNIIGQMGFIVFISLRTMWLSMRQLRPM